MWTEISARVSAGHAHTRREPRPNAPIERLAPPEEGISQQAPRCWYGLAGQVELPRKTVASQPQYSTRSIVHLRGGPHVHVLPHASAPWQSSPAPQSDALVQTFPRVEPPWGVPGEGGAGQPKRTGSIAATEKAATA